jgi:hypothetical protein
MISIEFMGNQLSKYLRTDVSCIIMRAHYFQFLFPKRCASYFEHSFGAAQLPLEIPIKEHTLYIASMIADIISDIFDAKMNFR